MKEVTILKVKRDHVEVLQNELEQFAKWQSMGFAFWSQEDFFNALATVDVALRLFVAMNRKLESESSSFKIKLKINEAVVVLKCCTWRRSGRSPYEVNVAEMYKGIVDQQLQAFKPVTN